MKPVLAVLLLMITVSLTTSVIGTEVRVDQYRERIFEQIERSFY